ncbi:hypothetical protein Tco_1449990 [Tanacetum coccineum]
MAKLALLALAFAAIVAFSEVSAYTTITTTTIMDDDFSNTKGSQSYQQCRRQIPIQENIEQECSVEAINRRVQHAPATNNKTTETGGLPRKDNKVDQQQMRMLREG